MRFTKEQKEFINCEAPKLLLEAPAGSGKTETVAERVRVKVEQGKRVQLACFTNAAKNTLQKRLDDAGVGVTVRTVDSLASELLRNELGNVFELGDGLAIAQEVCARTPVKPRDLLNFESLLSCGAPLPAGLPAVTAEVYDKYVEVKAERSYLTFTDAVLAAIGLREYGWDELIVDEAQDIQPKHMMMLESFGAKSMTLVGDSKQAIFGFSGVDVEHFAKLRKAGWETLHLTKTFRVPAGIVPVVNAVRDVPLVSARDGGKVSTIEASSADLAEALIPQLQPGDAVLGLTQNRLGKLASRLSLFRPDVPYTYSWSAAPSADSVHFATIHAAKGGEWSRVFVIDVSERGLYSYLNHDDKTLEMLFYVAASRASKELVLCQIGDSLPWGLSK